MPGGWLTPVWILAAVPFLAAVALALGTPSGGKQPVRDGCLTALMLISIGTAWLALTLSGLVSSISPPPAPKAADVETTVLTGP